MAQRIRGFGLFLMLTALTLWVPTEALAGGGKEGFRERVQKKISTQQSNIQYEPYYLQTDYQVRKDEAAPQQQAAPAMMGMDGGASGAAGQNLRAGGYQTSNYNAALASTVVATAAVVPAISRYAIYQTEYTAELEDNVVTVNGKVVFEVFEKGWTQLPLVKSNVGLINVSVNRGAAFVTMQGGKYYLMVDKPGRYTLNVEFLIKASRERERGPGHFNFDVMPAPISQFEFIIPETGVEIFVDPAIKVEVKKDADKTSAWAVMPNTNSITARWTKALPKEEIAPVKMEPKVYADTATYVSVGEGIIRSQTTVSYSILQSEVSTFRISIPEDVSLLDVQGSELRDWKVSKADGVQYLDVYLNFGIKGNYVLTMTYERNIGEGSVVADIPWVKATGVERENGFFGIAARTNVELDVSKIEHVTQIDVKELPSSIWGSSSNPILLAFKYLNHPFNITIDVTRHEEMPVLVAAIDWADFFTLYTAEGKVLTRATYQVRNNVKQFLRLGLPEGATLWSTFVAGKPVKPAKDKNGSIMVPLEKSQLQGESLTSFPVEIVYLNEGTKMQRFGRLTLGLPRVDIPISEIQWSAYFPSEFSYFSFGGDVKLVESPYRPNVPTFGLSRGIQGRLRSATDDIGEQYSAGNVQVAAKAPRKASISKEIESIQSKGILPIKISVPERGVSFRFTKLLVTEKESPSLTLRYSDVMKKFGGWIILALVIGLIVLLVKMIRKAVRK